MLYFDEYKRIPESAKAQSKNKEAMIEEKRNLLKQVESNYYAASKQKLENFN